MISLLDEITREIFKKLILKKLGKVIAVAEISREI